MIIFPGVLGDFLCFLPVAEALRQRARGVVTLVTRSAHRHLVDADHFHVVDIDRRDVAALFAADRVDGGHPLAGHGSAHSWTGSRDPHFARNLQTITAGPAAVYPFDGFQSDSHATDHFARRAGVRPIAPALPIGTAARIWAREVLGDGKRPTLVVHGGSGSRRKCWEGMPELVRCWRDRGHRAISIVGPADTDVPGCDLSVRDQPLDHIAALLAAAPVYVGNDSGISHLAAAAGGRGVALFGDTDPTIWRPRSHAVRLLHAPQSCGDCGANRLCIHRIPVAAVLEEVDRLRGESYRRHA